MQRIAPALTLTLALSFPAAAEEPSWLSRHLLYGGEVAVNLAPQDPGYFNHIAYSRDGLRLFRLNLALELRALETFSVLTEIRSDNLDAPRPYALYVRFRPFREHAFDVQAGRIPPVFGSFARRRYEYDNPLIGTPLPYQYPTVLRADAAPDDLEQLLYHRGYGSRVRYGVGAPYVQSGLAQVDPLRWDTGVEVKLGSEPLELALALTQGTVSSPRIEDDNDGKQLAGRLGWRPAFGASLGFSAARGDYISDDLKSQIPLEARSQQTSLGIDAEFSRGAWIVRGETIWSEWDHPTLSMGSLSALGWLVEGRYKLTAGVHVAARVGGLSFESIDAPGGPVSWDAPVTRVEAGLGVRFHRYVMAKAAIQYNERDGGPVTSRWLPALQMLLWF